MKMQKMSPVKVEVFALGLIFLMSQAVPVSYAEPGPIAGDGVAPIPTKPFEPESGHKIIVLPNGNAYIQREDGLHRVTITESPEQDKVEVKVDKKPEKKVVRTADGNKELDTRILLLEYKHSINRQIDEQVKKW